ncbi:diaminopimelate epimerase [Breoghania sp.]|uniref:diaminopimelate epimerase n=1 Tax=Breoghania sp. TaxID=2065378 RepID=UPI00260D529A|nr:diaminopimelate epimerase [Breoghania sp.]MDJ0930468.1 diaminopimelate epimerase [Breoghania sp.]
MTARELPFVKMNGLGNDFVVFDAREEPARLSDTQIAAIGSRTSGIGFDQMIIVEASPMGVDAFMRIYNCDGGQVDACGNATRCIGRLVMEEKDTDRATIQTNAGFLKAYATGNEVRVTVDMGEPKLEWQDIPLAEEFRDTRVIELQIGPIDEPVLHSPAVVNMGNPHAIFFVDDIEAYDLERFGPLLEHHPVFPERANVTLAQITGQNEIRAKVWERGVGLTRACGTAACATGVVAARKRLTGRHVTVTLPGGPLDIEWRESDGHVMMTGDTELEFLGTLDLDSLNGGKPEWRRETQGAA